MPSVADLRPCAVALVRVPLGRGGASVVVEKRLAPSVRRIDARYLADPRSRTYPIRKGDTGAYNCRKTTSGSSWSKHSYGAAVDINWSTNPYGRTLRTDMPAWFRQLWLDEGWGWGGNWRSVKDAMHFSKFPNEGGDGRLEDATRPAPAPTPPKEDAEMNQAERDLLHGAKNAAKEAADAAKAAQTAAELAAAAAAAAQSAAESVAAVTDGTHLQAVLARMWEAEKRIAKALKIPETDL